MDKKSLEGRLDEAKGQVKETAGVATGNRKLEAEGKLDELKGKVKKAVSDIKEGVEEKLDEGKLDTLKGRVKETVGVATGDRKLEGEGKLDTLKGNVKEKLSDLEKAFKKPDRPPEK